MSLRLLGGLFSGFIQQVIQQAIIGTQQKKVSNIIKKTIDEIKKAERQATRLLSDAEKKKEQILLQAREAIQQAEERQKKDLAKRKETLIEQATTRAKADAVDLLKKERSKIQDQTRRMEANVPKVASLIVKEFKKVVQ
ncbi:MAG: hypothetical protein GXP63_01550 [DPANN group archaeon]|nr:hypothetical protein [DPANN group archaeon]